MPERLRQSASARDSGHALFLRHCARCHGTADENRHQISNRYRTQAPDFTAPAYSRANPGALFLAIREGRAMNQPRGRAAGMPAWGAYLSEQQTWDLVVYLLSRSTSGTN